MSEPHRQPLRAYDPTRAEPGAGQPAGPILREEDGVYPAIVAVFLGNERVSYIDGQVLPRTGRWVIDNGRPNLRDVFLPPSADTGKLRIPPTSVPVFCRRPKSPGAVGQTDGNSGKVSGKVRQAAGPVEVYWDPEDDSDSTGPNALRLREENPQHTTEDGDSSGAKPPVSAPSSDSILITPYGDDRNRGRKADVVDAVALESRVVAGTILPKSDCQREYTPENSGAGLAESELEDLDQNRGERGAHPDAVSPVIEIIGPTNAGYSFHPGITDDDKTIASALNLRVPPRDTPTPSHPEAPLPSIKHSCTTRRKIVATIGVLAVAALVGAGAAYSWIQSSTDAQSSQVPAPSHPGK